VPDRDSRLRDIVAFSKGGSAPMRAVLEREPEQIEDIHTL
jgi:hypothetical protein